MRELRSSVWHVRRTIDITAAGGLGNKAARPR